MAYSRTLENHIIGNDKSVPKLSVLKEGSHELTILALSDNELASLLTNLLFSAHGVSDMKFLCSVSTDNLKHLQQVIETGRIKTLHLDQTTIPEKGIQAITSAIKINQLESFSLSGLEVTSDDQIQDLLDAIKQNTSLTQVSIQHCKFSPSVTLQPLINELNARKAAPRAESMEQETFCQQG